MNMELAQLRIFAAVVAQGSFAGAARSEGINPSQVSRAIAALEDRLKARMFERSTRAMALTEAGARFHARILPLIEELDAAMGAAGTETAGLAGPVRVTASTAFGEEVIVPVLDAFLARHPEIEVELVLSDSPLDLIAERIDLAVRMVPEAPPDFVVSRLGVTRYRVMATKEVAEGVDHPSALWGQDCVRFALPGFRDLWRFRQRDTEGRQGAVLEVPIRGRLEIAGALAVRAAAVRGLGPALLPEWLVQREAEAGLLVDMFPEWEVTATGFDTGVYQVLPSGRFVPARVRAFAEVLKRALAQRGIG